MKKRNIMELEDNIIEPVSVPFNGIFHCDTKDVFDSFEFFLSD